MRQLINNLNGKKNQIEPHIQPRLLKRLKMFTIIILVIFTIVTIKISRGDIRLFIASGGLAAGTILGFIAGRMFKISWDEDTQQVVSKLDRLGLVFLILYITVEVGRKWLFGYWLHGAALSAFGLIFLGGMLSGRLLAMAKKVRKVLKEENKLA